MEGIGSLTSWEKVLFCYSFVVTIMCTAEIDSICYYWSIHYQVAGTEFVDCFVRQEWLHWSRGFRFVLGGEVISSSIYIYITWVTWCLACYAKSGIGRYIGLSICRSSLNLYVSNMRTLTFGLERLCVV